MRRHSAPCGSPTGCNILYHSVLIQIFSKRTSTATDAAAIRFEAVIYVTYRGTCWTLQAQDSSCQIRREEIVAQFYLCLGSLCCVSLEYLVTHAAGQSFTEHCSIPFQPTNTNSAGSDIITSSRVDIFGATMNRPVQLRASQHLFRQTMPPV